MQPIPQPQVLDPDRALIDDRGDFFADNESRAEQAETALRQSCAYARQLWETLNDTRAYLMACLPPDPRTASGIHASNGAHPTGPDDEDGWNNWIGTFAAVTSTLCGPHGDSGFGLSEARDAARLRREAPIVTLREHHPTQSAPQVSKEPT